MAWNIAQSFTIIGGRLRAIFESILGKFHIALLILDKIIRGRNYLVYNYSPLELHCRSPGC